MRDVPRTFGALVVATLMMWTTFPLDRSLTPAERWTGRAAYALVLAAFVGFFATEASTLWTGLLLGSFGLVFAQVAWRRRWRWAAR